MAKAQFKLREVTNVIFVHCSATKPTQDIGAREIRMWHKHDNGWLDIGYHFVIRRNGVIENGRPVDVVGAHAYGYNGDSVGVCLVGGLDSSGKPDANFTAEQYEALKTLLRTLKASYPEASIKGHREVSDKACPSFDATAFVANMFSE